MFLIEFDSTAMLFLHPTKPAFLLYVLREVAFVVELLAFKLLQLRTTPLHNPKNRLCKFLQTLNRQPLANQSRICRMPVLLREGQMEFVADVGPFRSSCTLRPNSSARVLL